VRVERVRSYAARIPTIDAEESDGTLEWTSTTMVFAEVSAGGVTGRGYTYASAAARTIVEHELAQAIVGLSPFDIPRALLSMLRSIRNIGRGGVAGMAISAMDVALWDLKAKLLNVPLVNLLGRARDDLLVYASGGFTSRGPAELERELSEYREQGFRAVKMKVGRDVHTDRERVRAARATLGAHIDLMVDANGAYLPAFAVDRARDFSEMQVRWFEEPVSSDDLAGLAHVRAHAPPGMAIAAGEYGQDAFYFQRMLHARAVDVLQADATRCLGISGFLAADALCDALGRPLSCHCAPALHCAAAAAARRFVHLEYFQDHARIEHMLFEGAPVPRKGYLRADDTRPGLGLSLRANELKRFLI
jgi:L-alanine-DL-glutamate epimerase-like enolase superfamily enzyme